MADSFLTMFSPVGPPALNPWGVNDPVLTKYWVQGIHTKASAAPAVWIKMSQYLTKQAYMLPVYIFHNYWYASKSVGGIKFVNQSYPHMSYWYPQK
jgi:hypothetical protein